MDFHQMLLNGPPKGKCTQLKKGLNFVLQYTEIQITAKVDTAQYHYLNGRSQISSTDSKVRNTLYSIIISTTGKYCSATFI